MLILLIFGLICHFWHPIVTWDKCLHIFVQISYGYFHLCLQLSGGWFLLWKYCAWYHLCFLIVIWIFCELRLWFCSLSQLRFVGRSNKSGTIEQNLFLSFGIKSPGLTLPGLIRGNHILCSKCPVTHVAYVIWNYLGGGHFYFLYFWGVFSRRGMSGTPLVVTLEVFLVFNTNQWSRWHRRSISKSNIRHYELPNSWWSTGRCEAFSANPMLIFMYGCSVLNYLVNQQITIRMVPIWDIKYKQWVNS